MSKLNPFHLAVPVHDIDAARNFYGGLLNCEEGRSSASWIDFNLFGHQFVAHLKPGMKDPELHINPVDLHHVPVPHFGVVLDWDDWEALAQKLKDNEMKFIIEPYIRFKGKTGEQGTMFFQDPSGNVLEFKSFRDITQLFAN